MILGLGTDLVEVARISKSILSFGSKFTHRVFTERERIYCESKANSVERYSARFAAKEATMKALGTGWAQGISWTQIEVANESSGKPTLILHGSAKALRDKFGVQRSWLSISHTAQSAYAVVVFEG